MSTGYFFLEKLEKENMKRKLNLIIMLISFIRKNILKALYLLNFR